MNTFMTRVELHSATHWQDYNKLHAEMAREGFHRIIRAADGRLYDLPTAEYSLVGNVTASQVLDKAKRAATATGHRFGVIVSQTIQSTWVGLPIHQQHRAA